MEGRDEIYSRLIDLLDATDLDADTTREEKDLSTFLGDTIAGCSAENRTSHNPSDDDEESGDDNRNPPEPSRKRSKQSKQ